MATKKIALLVRQPDKNCAVSEALRGLNDYKKKGVFDHVCDRYESDASLRPTCLSGGEIGAEGMLREIRGFIAEQDKAVEFFIGQLRESVGADSIPLDVLRPGSSWQGAYPMYNLMDLANMRYGNLTSNCSFFDLGTRRPWLDAEREREIAEHPERFFLVICWAHA